jgi:hypothetical protein
MLLPYCISYVELVEHIDLGTSTAKICTVEIVRAYSSQNVPPGDLNQLERWEYQCFLPSPRCAVIRSSAHWRCVVAVLMHHTTIITLLY